MKNLSIRLTKLLKVLAFLIAVPILSCIQHDKEMFNGVFSNNGALPSVTTEEVTNITDSSAISGGSLLSNGESYVYALGVCWSTNDNPKIDGNHSMDGKEFGNFTSTITGLEYGTVYYIRAYASNNIGTSYGSVITFKTEAILPTISTSTISVTGITTAAGGGNISNDGRASITARGVCWSTSIDPTVSLATKTDDGTLVGQFTSNITGLTPGTFYYVRAYATNSAGTAYGTNLTFSTAKEESTLTDMDNNVYNTITIGTQVWMTENLKTTRFKDGSSIPFVEYGTDFSRLVTPGYCWYESNDASNKNTYGALYNWYTVNTGKLCPTGWHVPTDEDWTNLSNYLGVFIAGGKLKETGTSHWLSPNTGATNSTGFTALPGGVLIYERFDFIGRSGFWWSASEYSDGESAWWRFMNYDYNGLGTNRGLKRYGVSVRCIKD